jgi:ketosteroid isomerase-like protein
MWKEETMNADVNLRKTLDEVEIRNVIASIAMLADDGDLNEYGTFFAEDAHWEMRTEPGKPPMFPPVKGRAAVMEAGRQRRADGIAGPGTHTYHAIQTTMVKVTGDTATARSYLVFYKNAHVVPEAALMKVYRDEFRRTADGWKLAVRLIDPA